METFKTILKLFKTHSLHLLVLIVSIGMYQVFNETLQNWLFSFTTVLIAVIIFYTAKENEMINFGWAVIIFFTVTTIGFTTLEVTKQASTRTKEQYKPIKLVKPDEPKIPCWNLENLKQCPYSTWSAYEKANLAYSIALKQYQTDLLVYNDRVGKESAKIDRLEASQSFSISMLTINDWLFWIIRVFLSILSDIMLGVLAFKPLSANSVIVNNQFLSINGIRVPEEVKTPVKTFKTLSVLKNGVRYTEEDKRVLIESFKTTQSVLKTMEQFKIKTGKEISYPTCKKIVFTK